MNHRTNVLLVDDQPARLLSYRAILQPLNENLVETRSGTEALRKIMEQDFSVILLDVSMPGMNGFETAEMIHQHPRFEKTPIIFVTALHQTDMDRMKGYALGAVDYVYVPVVPEILRTKVAVLVELYCKRREQQELNRSLELANAELARTNALLQAEKSRELQELNATLERANLELELANRNLHSHIAERERLELALREADKRKDEFLAILAHELRNPLAPIRNGVQVMRVKVLDDPDLCWSRDVIDRQVEILIRLVDDLLDVSRISQGKIHLHKEVVDLRDVATRAIETNHLTIDTRQQQFTLELPDHPVHVHGDRTRLAQVIGNLLGNAAKYTDVGGRILLRLEISSDEDKNEVAVIRVRDTGIGIPPAMLPKLFELFTQLKETVDRAQGGLGIGLALVRRMVEMHGGCVSAHSEGPGCGSEFVVRLPVWSGSEPTPDSPNGAAPIRAKRQRFLVADDNPDSVLTLAMLLRASGFEVCTAADGLEAVEQAERELPDVVLLDLGMPNLDGYGAARRIRAQPWGKELLLIALTGWGQEEARRLSRESGFDAHLIKPVELPELLTLVNKISKPRSAARATSVGGEMASADSRLERPRGASPSEVPHARAVAED